jgi:transposase
MTTTRPSESTAPVLLMAFELGQRAWKIGFTVGVSQRPRVRIIPSGAIGLVMEEIARAKRRFSLSAATMVISCYEAGRDAFWLHRALTAQGITNVVVDSASIEVNRRARRAKTDLLDLGGLLNLLARYVHGDRRCWRVVRVPTLAEEDGRQFSRTLETLTQDRTRLISRLKALLATQGLTLTVGATFQDALAAARLWDGTPVPAGLHDRLLQDWTQLQQLEAQLRELRAAARRPAIATPAGRLVAQLQTLRAVGPITAHVLTSELFAWRQIRNGRQLGALVGLVPAPYQSGESHHEHGITRAGNTHVRRVMVQLAWGWLYHQPMSALARWYQRRFATGGPRVRRIGIVALARKLVIALWRYIDQQVTPEGAQLKAGESVHRRLGARRAVDELGRAPDAVRIHPLVVTRMLEGALAFRLHPSRLWCAVPTSTPRREAAWEPFAPANVKPPLVI